MRREFPLVGRGAGCRMMPSRPRGRPGAHRGRAAAAAIGVLGLAFAVLVWLVASLVRPRRRASAGAPGGAGAARPRRPLAPSQQLAPPEQASGDRPPPRRRWYGLVILALLAGMVAGIVIFFFFRLNQRLWPVRLNASASTTIRNAGILQDLRLTAAGNGSHVRWLVDSGYVRQLIVSGSDTEIILPLPPSECRAAGKALDATCVGGQLRTGSPVTFIWSSIQKFASTGNHTVVSADLDIAPLVARPGVLGVYVTATASTGPSYCFNFQQGVTLTLSSGGRTSTRSEQPSECFPDTRGLHVLVGSAGTGLPPAIEFDGVEYLTMHARASAGILYGFAGQLELSPGPTTVPGSPAWLCSKTAPCRLTAVFKIDNASQSLELSAQNVTRVVTNVGQLVPSAWTQNSDKFVPLFRFIFTIFVITPLTPVIGVLTDALKNWSPRPQRDRGARKLPKPRSL